MPPDDDILRIALDLADGKSVDWKSETDSAPVPLRAVIDNLRSVSSLSSVAGRGEAATDDDGATTAIWGPFEILSEDGSDGFYERFRARDPRTEEAGELRLLNIPDGVSTFERAAAESNAMERLRALIGLDAPGLLSVRRVAYHQGRLGVWCGEQPTSTRDFRGVEPLSFARKLAEALQPLHEKGIVHGGLRPESIRIAPSGLAIDLPAPCLDPLLSRHMRTWLPWPECSYLAPEAHSSATATAAADVYGIGAIIHYVLTGDPPSSALTADEWFAERAGDVAREPRSKPDGPAASVCQQTMQWDPSARPQTMDELLTLIGNGS